MTTLPPDTEGRQAAAAAEHLRLLIRRMADDGTYEGHDLRHVTECLADVSRLLNGLSAPPVPGEGHPLTAGARIRLTIEDAVESLDSGKLRTTRGVILSGHDAPGAARIEVLTPGWQPGDVVEETDGGRLTRCVIDDEHVWKTPHGRTVYDDETGLHCLHRIDPARPA